MSVCNYDDCREEQYAVAHSGPASGLGLCRIHYTRNLRGGKMNRPIRPKNLVVITGVRVHAKVAKAISHAADERNFSQYMMIAQILEDWYKLRVANTSTWALPSK